MRQRLLGPLGLLGLLGLLATALWHAVVPIAQGLQSLAFDIQRLG